jgi:hypothetical protein
MLIKISEGSHGSQIKKNVSGMDCISIRIGET